MSSSGSEDRAAERGRLVTALRRSGILVSRAVEAAMLAVPRERFVPDGDLEAAYDDRAIVTKVVDGQAVSSISQPTMVVWMLEALAVEPGDHVLEVGAGTGYNAALLAELVGPAGRVVTVDVDAEVAAGAAAVLEPWAGLVRVVVGDGRAGCPEAAPFHRVVVTAGADRVEPAWAEQLAEGGRLVVPIARDRQAYAYEKRDGALAGPVATSPAGFVPLR